MIKNKSNKIDMSVEVKTIYPDGIIFFTHDSDGTHIMAIYLKDGRVILIIYSTNNFNNYISSYIIQFRYTSN